MLAFACRHQAKLNQMLRTPIYASELAAYTAQAICLPLPAGCILLIIGAPAELSLQTLWFASLLYSCIGRLGIGGDENVPSDLTANSTNQLSCSASVPKLVHEQSWSSARTNCLTDITLVTSLTSSQ